MVPSKFISNALTWNFRVPHTETKQALLGIAGGVGAAATVAWPLLQLSASTVVGTAVVLEAFFVNRTQIVELASGSSAWTDRVRAITSTFQLSQLKEAAAGAAVVAP